MSNFMDDLNKQAAPEAEEKPQGDKPEGQDADKQGEEPKGSDIQKGIDYEAELKKEREAREKAEQAAADAAFKLREKSRNNKQELDEQVDDEDKPLTAKDLKTYLDKQNQDMEKRLSEQKVSDMIEKFADSKEEAAYVKDIFQNRQFPSHLSLEDQVEEAYLIANRKKILGENSELKMALKNKRNVNTNAAGSHDEGLPSVEPELPSDIKTVIKQGGYTFNNSTRRWEKKTSNGTILVYDTKSKRITQA